MTTSDIALLVLEDGTVFKGRAWGAKGRTLGEIVFSTGMTGYQETLTDPSYHRQIVVMTAPHIGNTGVNDEDPESSRIWVAGFVVRDGLALGEWSPPGVGALFPTPGEPGQALFVPVVVVDVGAVEAVDDGGGVVEGFGRLEDDEGNAGANPRLRRPPRALPRRHCLLLPAASPQPHPRPTPSPVPCSCPHPIFHLFLGSRAGYGR